MALRKVRSNLDRLFDKSLTDLIRGIRNNKDNEVSMSYLFLLVTIHATLLIYKVEKINLHGHCYLISFFTCV